MGFQQDSICNDASVIRPNRTIFNAHEFDTSFLSSILQFSCLSPVLDLFRLFGEAHRSLILAIQQ